MVLNYLQHSLCQHVQQNNQQNDGSPQKGDDDICPQNISRRFINIDLQVTQSEISNWNTNEKCTIFYSDVSFLNTTQR